MTLDPRKVSGASSAETASPRLTVVSISDALFFPGVLVTFYSLLRHLAPGWSVDFKLVTDGLDECRLLALERVLQATGRDCSLEIIQPDLTEFADYPAHNGTSKMAYACLLIPGLVASDRALYVDSDIVVMTDVSRLAGLPSRENHVLHAVDDARLKIVSAPWEKIPYEQLGIPPDAPYFNTGFLWMDLAEWRRQDISRACREYARRFPGGIAFWDQSILNAVLWQRRTPLDKAWNLPADDSLARLALYPLAATIDANVHYLGAGKPWLDMNPFQQFYQVYADEIAPLMPPELAPRQKVAGETAQRLRYFTKRAYWHYGSFVNRGLRKVLHRSGNR